MVKRTIYSYETVLLTLNEDGNMAERKFDSHVLEQVFSYLSSLPKEKRVEDKKGEWFFYLAKLNIDKRDDPTHKDCLYGWFEWVRYGFRTDLMSRSTLTPRPNPKGEDESEIHRTYFYLRLHDGLFLIDSYSGNVVTPKRIEAYIEKKSEEIFKNSNVRYISFRPIISQGFLEELNKFDMIRLARIRLRVQENTVYDTSDAIGQLQEMSRPTKANYLDIMLGRKNARKHGLIVTTLKDFLQKLMRNEEEVISGTIEGSRSDGGSPVLHLHGIEEKFKSNFETDAYGEALFEPMFEYMIRIGNDHNKLF